MKWLELKLDTSPAGLEAATQLLEEQGITGLVIDDEGISGIFWSTITSTGIMWTRS